MIASELMTRAVQSCTPSDNLQHVADIMWRHDCGAVPVIDVNDHVIGMITDRDICMAAFTQNRLLGDIPVSSAMARSVHAVSEQDPIEIVEAVMCSAKVRRVPVVDHARHLKGILSLHDLAQHVHGTQGSVGRRDALSCDSVAKTLAEICEPRGASA